MKPTVDLAWLARESDRIRPELAPPGLPGSGVCSTCRTWSDTNESMCSNCSEVRDALGAAARPLNVATLYRKPSTLRDWLTGYKGDAEGTEPADPASLPPVRALLGRFLLEHGDTIAERAGGLDAIVVVPSTDRLPPHPLIAIIDSLRLDVPLLRSLTRTTGVIGFRRPNPEAYAVTEAIRPGTRLLIIDDVYTTGAHANSAASALRTAGAHVAGLLVLARRINPDYSPAATDFWAAQSSQPFDWTRSPVLASPADGTSFDGRPITAEPEAARRVGRAGAATTTSAIGHL